MKRSTFPMAGRGLAEEINMTRGTASTVSKAGFTILTLTIVLLSVLQPEFASFYVVKAGGVPAYLSLAALGTGSVIGLLDMLSEPLRKRFKLHGCKFRYRLQVAWMVVAMTYAGHSWILIKDHRTGVLAGICLMCTFVACHFAFSDAIGQHRKLIERHK